MEHYSHHSWSHYISFIYQKIFIPHLQAVVETDLQLASFVVFVCTCLLTGVLSWLCEHGLTRYTQLLVPTHMLTKHASV